MVLNDCRPQRDLTQDFDQQYSGHHLSEELVYINTHRFSEGVLELFL